MCSKQKPHAVPLNRDRDKGSSVAGAPVKIDPIAIMSRSIDGAMVVNDQFGMRVSEV